MTRVSTYLLLRPLKRTFTKFIIENSAAVFEYHEKIIVRFSKWTLNFNINTCFVVCHSPVSSICIWLIYSTPILNWTRREKLILQQKCRRSVLVEGVRISGRSRLLSPLFTQEEGRVPRVLHFKKCKNFFSISQRYIIYFFWNLFVFLSFISSRSSHKNFWTECHIPIPNA